MERLFRGWYFSRVGMSALVLGCFAGCAALQERLSDAPVTDSSGGIVIMRVGTKVAIVSPWDRERWASVKAGNGSAALRVQGALATGDAEAAIQTARAELVVHPKDRVMLGLLASAHIMAQHYKLAEYYAGLLEKNYPGSSEALTIQGLSTMMLPEASVADLGKAEGLFAKAMDRSPSEVAAALNLAALQLDMGGAGQARTTYADAAGRCGQCREALLGVGIAAGRSGEWAISKAALERVLQKNPSDGEGLYYSAVLAKVGYNDQIRAADYLHRILDRDGVGTNALRDRARVVLRSLKAGNSTEK